MSYVKRQELFDNINPLLKKYKYDGEVPPQYIPPKKRKVIQRYMDRSSVSPGYYIAAQDHELGNTTTKGHAELINQRQSDYQRTLSERIEDGARVKHFMNKQRIEMGREGSREQLNRQRGDKISKSPVKGQGPEPYSMLKKQREEIKESTNRVNCFVDENEPTFINTMSRTMDAFDLRMGTFGGVTAANKEQHYDKFIQEKRGFIRTINGYDSKDPTSIVDNERHPRIYAPGPEFDTSYDNRYQQNTVYAVDEGRVKETLNLGKQDKQVLKNSHPPKMYDNLKYSNIHFVHDEMGAVTVQNKKASQRNFGIKKNSVSVTNPNGNHTTSQVSIDNEYGNEGARSGTSQSLRQKKNGTIKAAPQWEQSPFHKNKSYQQRGANHKYSNSTRFDNTEKPYEMWKQQMVSDADKKQLGAHRNLILNYDQSSKAHLTTAKGGPNKVDYVTSLNTYHGNEKQVDPRHVDLDQSVHRFMKKPNYSIGKKGQDAPNEKISSNMTYHTQRQHDEDEPPKVGKNDRRCDPENPNRILTVGFGFGSEKGTYEHQVNHRQNTFYKNQYNKRDPHLERSVTQAIAKDRGNFNLSNKFQYGTDMKGGAKAGKVPEKETAINECLDMSAVGHGQREEFKEKIERQNFTIQHDKQLANSDTKYIGTHKGKGIDNLIDQDDLKRSHMPFDPIGKPDKLKLYGSFYGSTNSKHGLVKPAPSFNDAHGAFSVFKKSSVQSKVPFSPTKRNRLERDYGKFDRVNGYDKSVNSQAFNWKVPTYDLK